MWTFRGKQEESKYVEEEKRKLEKLEFLINFDMILIEFRYNKFIGKCVKKKFFVIIYWGNAK